MLITEFYKNKELFITGGTGYLGKSLIEKLLRDCPDLSKIYLLIREKKNKTPWERLKEFSNDLVFERLHREQPKAFEKIIPIDGDCCKLGLGICSKDLERLKNVNIIIHGAANVRFDSNLSSAILMNTRGTHELLKLAITLKNLLAFIHVSTAYVSPFQSYVKEQMCDAPVDWRSAVKIAENLEVETLEILKAKYSKFPNSYSFTKNLSEQVVAEFADKLPITILRPSVVSHSIKEPEPGFIDNLNGPMGLLVAIALGIAQITYCDKNLNMAFIPVDTTSILTIVAAYRRGLETINTKKYGLDIRNLTPGRVEGLTLGQNTEVFLRYTSNEPFEQSLWAPTGYMTTNFSLFIMCVFLVNIPLAVVYDSLLMLSKKETMVMKLTRKLVSTSKAVGRFSREFFYFENDGMWDLVKIIPAEEKEKFGDYFILKDLNLFTILKQLRDGIKKYILKQPIKATLATQRRYMFLIILDKLIKAFIFFLVISFLWRMVN